VLAVMTGRMDWEDGAILPDNSLRLQ